MNKLLTQLTDRFGANKVQLLEKKNEGDYPLVLIDAGSDRKAKVLMTIGLSDYIMPVDQKHEDRAYIELYFCLPSYWDISDINNLNFNWVFEWIQRLTKFVVEKKTWFAHGHTIPAGNPPEQLSPTMKQTYFVFSNPIALKEELTPLQVDENIIHFLAIIPLFKDEFEYKTARGMFKFILKFEGKNYSEILDDYRVSAVRKKYLLF